MTGCRLHLKGGVFAGPPYFWLPKVAFLVVTNAGFLVYFCPSGHVWLVLDSFWQFWVFLAKTAPPLFFNWFQGGVFSMLKRFLTLLTLITRLITSLMNYKGKISVMNFLALQNTKNAKISAKIRDNLKEFLA